MDSVGTYSLASAPKDCIHVFKFSFSLSGLSMHATGKHLAVVDEGGSVSIMDLSYGTSVPQRVSNARIVYTSPIIYYTTMHHPYTIMHDHLFALQHYRPSAGTVTAPPTHTHSFRPETHTWQGTQCQI